MAVKKIFVSLPHEKPQPMTEEEYAKCKPFAGEARLPSKKIAKYEKNLFTINRPRGTDSNNEWSQEKRD